MPSQPVTINLPDGKTSLWPNQELQDNLDKRKGRHGTQSNGQPAGTTLVASFDLHRHYRALAGDLATIHVPDSELPLLIQGLWDQDFLDPRNLDQLHLRWLGNLGLGPRDEHPILVDRLYGKLEALTPGQRLALADAFEQARSETYPEPNDDPLTRLKKIGLVKE